MIGYLTHNQELVQAFRVHRFRGAAGGGAGPSARLFKSAVKLSELFSTGETVLRGGRPQGRGLTCGLPVNMNYLLRYFVPPAKGCPGGCAGRDTCLWQ